MQLMLFFSREFHYVHVHINKGSQRSLVDIYETMKNTYNFSFYTSTNLHMNYLR